MEKLFEQIYKEGIVPVLAIEDAEKAAPTAKALQRGGLDCVEITFRTAAAAEAIRWVTREVPEMLIGAGTVLRVEQVKEAVDAGARFIVTPGYNPKVVDYCVGKGIPVIPGCMDTASMEMAMEAGLEIVKFFPAEAAGGLSMLKALAGPYSNLRFMPTGGINASNLGDYLSYDKVLACGGSWMVKKALIEEGRYEEITRLSAEAVQHMLGLTLAGIGAADGQMDGERQVPPLLRGFFPADHQADPTSLLLHTRNIVRARHHLEKQGFTEGCRLSGLRIEFVED